MDLIETDRLERVKEYWKQKLADAELKKSEIERSVSEVELTKLKISELHQVNDRLKNKIMQQNEEIASGREKKTRIEESMRDLNIKHKKLTDNHFICSSELEKIKELENQYINPDMIVSLICNWNNPANVQQLVFRLEDYLISKNKEELHK